MKTKSLGLFLVLALALAASASAGKTMGRHHGDGAMMPRWEDPAVAKELGLSDDQVKKLTAERDAFKDEMQATRQDMRDLMDAQRTLLASEKVDQAAFKTNVEKMASLKAEHVRKMGDHMLVVRDILSAEQFAKLHEMRPMGGKMHGDGMGMGHDCSGCPAAN